MFISRFRYVISNKMLYSDSHTISRSDGCALLFNKSEWVTDWSDLMISCFTSYITFTLNVYVW